MIDAAVRRATVADAWQLDELGGEARAALVGQRGATRWLEEHPDRHGRWRSVIEEQDVFVAEIDEVVVGYLVVDLARSAGHVALVDEVYVTPAAREVGFGDALLAAAIEHARRAGAAFLDAHALPGDRETKNLYERAGITARLITVSTTLTE